MKKTIPRHGRGPRCSRCPVPPARSTRSGFGGRRKRKGAQLHRRRERRRPGGVQHHRAQTPETGNRELADRPDALPAESRSRREELHHRQVLGRRRDARPPCDVHRQQTDGIHASAITTSSTTNSAKRATRRTPRTRIRSTRAASPARRSCCRKLRRKASPKSTSQSRATGKIWVYGNNFGQFQKNVSQDSRGIYAVYIHSDPYFRPDNRSRGRAADSPLRHSGDRP